MTPLLYFVDALTAGESAPALLVQVEPDWAALALQPSTILLVALEAHAGETWDVIGERARAVLRTEQPEVIAGLHAKVMVVVLIGSTLGAKDLADAPKTIAGLDRIIQWIAISPDWRIATTEKAPSIAVKEIVPTIRTALQEGAPAMSDEARVLVERHGEEALANEAHFRNRLKSSLAPYTVGLLLVCGAMYVAELVTGATQSTAGLLRIGGLAGTLVLRGHFELLLSYSLLHAGFLHIAMNGISLASVGGALEGMVGGLRMIFVFTITALAAGAAVAFIHPHQLVVGASGGIFGLLTALFGIALRGGNEVPALARARIRASMRSTLIINLLISLMPGISLLAHAGGALAGLILGVSGALTAGVSYPWRAADPTLAARTTFVFRVLGIASIVALLGSVAIAWLR